MPPLSSRSFSRKIVRNTSGFTLFEMMIVIAILGVFFVAVSYMNRDVRIDQTRAERLANIVYDQIRSARNN
ncbi:prepilin-type N-terminal cleavage/methylation domain-containing protein, partial [Candidatus Gracilibacteria bacterium]|nr:prepilin-type N-terminal cleavage/methylation domain-containing protein [Candidatus Gracilibacteria bacterium]